MNSTVNGPKVELYGLVRDKDGKPRIDGDPRKLPRSIIRMMSVWEFKQAIRDYEEGNNANS